MIFSGVISSAKLNCITESYSRVVAVKKHKDIPSLI